MLAASEVADAVTRLLSAFTLGQDIYFGRDAFTPGTTRGDRLLAHELTHVAQHEQGRLARADSAAVVMMDGSIGCG